MAKASTIPEPGKPIRLNKSNIDSIQLPGVYPDDELKGFRLWVGKSGVKSFQVVGKVKGEPRPVYYTIGKKDKEGEVWTPDRARKEATRIRLLMQTGINPNAQKKEDAAQKEAVRAQKADEAMARSITVKQAFTDFLAEGKQKASTVYVYRCVFNKCFGDWLNRPLLDITEEDVVERHKKISKDHPGDANHSMRVLRGVFNFAMYFYKSSDRRAVVKENPVSILSKRDKWNELKPRTGRIKGYHLAAFFEACTLIDHPVASDYFRFLVLTGLRLDEAASLPWSEVDFKGKSITLLDTKNGRDHRLPLTDYLYDMLKTRWQNRQGPFVFSSPANPDRYQGDYDDQRDLVIARVRALLAQSNDEELRIGAESFSFLVHDLRRTFTDAAKSTEPEYIVKGLLNHMNKGDVTQTHYAQTDLECLRKPMQRVGDHILGQAGVASYSSVPGTAGSRVIKMAEVRRKRSRAK